MINAIIFDCFGVLVEDSLKPFYRKYFQDDPEKIRLTIEQLEASNKGTISFDEFTAYLGELAGISTDQARRALDSNPRNEQLLCFIRDELVGKYKIGFLSNASADWLSELFRPEDLELFQTMVLSFKIGFAKPEARAFEITADRLEVRLDECIFIDDHEGYVEGAQHVGMKTILYADFESFKSELANLLV